MPPSPWLQTVAQFAFPGGKTAIVIGKLHHFAAITDWDVHMFDVCFKEMHDTQRCQYCHYIYPEAATLCRNSRRNDKDMDQTVDLLPPGVFAPSNVMHDLSMYGQQRASTLQDTNVRVYYVFPNDENVVAQFIRGLEAAGMQRVALVCC